MSKDQWSLGSAVARNRNWNPSSFIDTMFGEQNFSKTGELAFKRQLYQSQIGQALLLKTGRYCVVALSLRVAADGVADGEVSRRNRSLAIDEQLRHDVLDVQRDLGK
jgi:hypothetical protein